MLIWLCTCVCLILAIRYYLRSLRVTGYSDKYVLITGCDTGFGNVLAKSLNQDGFNVVAGCLTEAGVEELTTVSSGKIVAVKLDITNDEDIQSVADKVNCILPEGTGLWALVNNAGILGPFTMVDCLTKQDYLKVMEVNLFGHIEMVNKFLPLLRKAKGRIVIASSAVGRAAVLPLPCYIASKYALEGYSDTLRIQQHFSGISVHLIEASGNNTQMATDENTRKNIRDSFSKASDSVREFYGEDFPERWAYNMFKMIPINAVMEGLEPVVEAYAHAITSRYPKARYLKGYIGNLLCWPLTMLPEAIGDILCRQTYILPAKLRPPKVC